MEHSRVRLPPVWSLNEKEFETLIELQVTIQDALETITNEKHKKIIAERIIRRLVERVLEK